MRAVTAAEMRQIEDDAIASDTTVEELMQRAGRAVADAVVDSLGGAVAQRRVVVLAGPGKNGGDGLIAARLLRQRGAAVSVVCPIPRADDPLLAECEAAGCLVIPDVGSSLAAALSNTDIVIDALIGTGRSRAIDGPILEALHLAREAASNTTFLAVDVPSGLDSDSGEVDPATLRADVTVALASVKIGCLTRSGAEMCGQINVAEIGLDALATIDEGIGVLTSNDVAALLPERQAAGHKGTFGHSLIIGGSEAYRGAPALAARAALRTGAGTAAIAAPESISDSITLAAPEATHLPLPVGDDLSLDPRSALIHMEIALIQKHPAAIGIGPGLIVKDGYRDLLPDLIDLVPDDVPLVFDADALGMLSLMPDWWTRMDGQVVITPHPGEMARLCDMSVQDVQANRIELAVEKAREWGVTVVLKGAYTVVASPDAPPAICPLAMPALASGGTGDALAGIITGLLSQGLATSEAARAGVYVHGAAAVLAARDNGNMTSGLLASDLIEEIPAATALIGRGEGPVPPMFA